MAWRNLTPLLGSQKQADTEYLAGLKQGLSRPNEYYRNQKRLDFIIPVVGSAGLNTDEGNKFVYTCKYGWVDMGHFFRNANATHLFGNPYPAYKAAEIVELSQYHIGRHLGSLSGFAVEDLVSNNAGRDFGTGLGKQNLAQQWEQFLKDAGAVKWDSISEPIIMEDQRAYQRNIPMPRATTVKEGLQWQKAQNLSTCLCDDDMPRLEQHRF